MAIETVCEGCARRLRVPDEHAGKKARCPQCGTIYIVPGQSAEGSADTDASRRSEDVQSEASHAHDEEFQQEPERHEIAGRDGEGQDAEGEGTEESLDRWQLRTPNGQVYGPVPKEELDQWCAEGRIPPAASVLHEGEAQWRDARVVYPQLGRIAGRRQRPDNPFADFSSSAPARPFAQRHQLPHRGVLILVLAVLGGVFCPVFALMAWSMGTGDLRSIRLGRMDPSGESLTKAGMALGMIETILVGIICVLVCFGVLG